MQTKGSSWCHQSLTDTSGTVGYRYCSLCAARSTAFGQRTASTVNCVYWQEFNRTDGPLPGMCHPRVCGHAPIHPRAPRAFVLSMAAGLCSLGALKRARPIIIALPLSSRELHHSRPPRPPAHPRPPAPLFSLVKHRGLPLNPRPYRQPWHPPCAPLLRSFAIAPPAVTLGQPPPTAAR